MRSDAEMILAARLAWAASKTSAESSSRSARTPASIRPRQIALFLVRFLFFPRPFNKILAELVGPLLAYGLGPKRPQAALARSSRRMNRNVTIGGNGPRRISRIYCSNTRSMASAGSTARSARTASE